MRKVMGIHDVAGGEAVQGQISVITAIIRYDGDDEYHNSVL